MADDTEKAQWQQTSGFAADSTRVTLVVDENTAEQWSTEADEHGYSSRNKYLYDLIQEAQAYRDHDIPGPRHANRRIQELEEEIDRLKDRLQREQQKHGGRPAIDDIDFLEEFLTDQFQPLHEILQAIVESGALNDLIRKRVEDQLYYLAAENRVEYNRVHGWKRVDGDA
ncbi:hypothetical protein [Halomontanus rarus]|uniref:hypothetical protein n=1 Tax=Halomontanus rarus TaxID=3034020 RepID=UPI001A99DD17